MPQASIGSTPTQTTTMRGGGTPPLELHLLMCLCLCSSIVSSSDAVQLVLSNGCGYSVWPGVIGNGDYASLDDGGFHLGAHQEAVLDVPNGWSGRVWGRRGCRFNGGGEGSCETGDCGGLLRCGKISGRPPATVVEMTFGSGRSADHFYDVSLVDGFNLPVRMTAVGEGSRCGVAGCEVDVNTCCPSRFEVRLEGRTVGCQSACQALRTDRYCCTGEYNSQERCRPTLFSHLFKVICPRAYSFPYDYETSQKACNASRYLITFCPPPF